MKLHTLKRSKGIVSKAKRLGRGNGSGKGNYSTKGLKGQKARSGSGMKPFFEGGQTSIVQRIPKAKGFKRYFKLIKEVAIVNLGNLDLDERITNGIEITKELLKDLGYIKNINVIVKVLGNGDWTKTATFTNIDLFSKSAQEKIANPSAKSTEPKKASVKKETEGAKKPVAKKEEKEEGDKKSTVKKAPAKKETTTKKPAAKKEAKK